MKHLKTTLKIMFFLVLGLSILLQTTYAAGEKKANVVLKAMEEELARSMKVLGEKGTPPPYFISYRITDDYSVNVAENPVHVHDLQATILHQLGIDHERLTYRYQGRHFRLTDVHGRVVRDILT